MTMRPNRLLHGPVGAFYALITFLVLHTILFHNGTHWAGYDAPNFHWNFWWIRHALSTPSLQVFETNYVMTPATINFAYHTLSAGWYPVWAVLEPLIGTLSAVNVIIVLSCWLNGVVTYCWLRSEGIRLPFALLGGLMLQVLPITRYFYYNTHLNLMIWFVLPLLALIWGQLEQAIHQPHTVWHRLAWALLLGGLAYWVMLTDLQFPLFMAFWLIPLGLRTLWRLKGWSLRLRLVALGSLAMVVSILLLWFFGPLPYVLRLTGTLIPGNVLERPGIPFPQGLLAMAHEWWMWHSPSLGWFTTLSVMVAVVVALIGGRRRQHDGRWFWLAMALPPLILALGPTVQIGTLVIPMPYRWLFEVTKGNFRMPWRLAPIFVLASAAFIGRVGQPWWFRLKPTARTWGALALLLLSISNRLYETAPLQAVLPNYDYYHMIGNQVGDYVVVEVPTGAGTGEVLLGNTAAIQYQWYGIAHGKRMVNGFVARAPIEYFYAIDTLDPMLAWLGQRRLLDTAAVEAQLRERISTWPIGYLVVHQDLIGRHSPTAQEIIGYFNQRDDLLCPVAIEGDVVFYRTVSHPLGCPRRTPPKDDTGSYSIDLGTAGDERFIGWGWHWPETFGGISVRWAGEYPQALVYADVPTDAYRLTFAVQAFQEPRQIQVKVNDQRIGQAVIVQPNSMQVFSIDVPASVIGAGRHVSIALVYDKTIIPREIGQSDDPRKLSIAVDWIKLVPLP